jgi:hypothetical protein
MSDAVQIFSVADVLERIDANEQARSLHVYAGHVDEATKNALVVLYLVRQPGEAWPAKKLQQFKKLRGHHTALFKPGNEVMYFSSEGAGANQYQYPNINGGVDFNAITPHHGKELRELIQEVLRLEKLNIELQAQVSELTDELKYYQDGRAKFSGAMEDVFMKIVPRLFPETKAFFSNEQPIQGTMNEWQKIDLRGNDEQTLENALAVLLAAFGDEKIISFARQLQADPAKVDMLSKFI